MIKITLDSHGYFEPSSERQQIVGMKAQMVTLWKIAVVEITCWELKSHLLRASMLLTLSYDVKVSLILFKGALSLRICTHM